MLITSLIASVTFWSPAPEGWLSGYDLALSRAKESGRLIFAEFTGSDWCSPCKLLEEQVLGKAEFKDWAKENVVLLQLDYPKHHRLPSRIESQNLKLRSLYSNQIQDRFPTMVVLQSDGKPIGVINYAGGGPEDMIATIKEVIASVKPEPNQSPKG